MPDIDCDRKERKKRLVSRPFITKKRASRSKSESLKRRYIYSLTKRETRGTIS